MDLACVVCNVVTPHASQSLISIPEEILVARNLDIVAEAIGDTGCFGSYKITMMTGPEVSSGRPTLHYSTLGNHVRGQISNWPPFITSCA